MPRTVEKFEPATMITFPLKPTLIALFALAIAGTNASAQTDTIHSYDNFNNKPKPTSSFVVIKSKSSGAILYEHSTGKGLCSACYDDIASKADSCYRKKNYADAAVLYHSAFLLNDNKGKVKHRLVAACCYVKLSDFDRAFDNLERIVFGARFSNYNEITSNDCYKPLKKDARWNRLIEGLKKNVEETQLRIKAEAPTGM